MRDDRLEMREGSVWKSSVFFRSFICYLLSIIILSSSAAHAACSNPSGDAGKITYNTTHNVVQYCDGTDWIGFGPANSGAGSGGCSSPSGVEGQITFNTSENVLQYCDGAGWVQVGGSGVGSVVPNGLIGHWKLDSDTAGVTADAAGNNDCTFNNSPTTLPSGGLINGAVDFDDSDDDYLDCGSDASLDDLGPFSASMWVNVRDRRYGTMFIAKGYPNNVEGWWFATNGFNDSGALIFHAVFDTTKLEVETGDGYLNETAWHHLVVTWDGSTNASGAKIYVNGVEASYDVQIDGAGTYQSDATRNMYIGRHSGSSDALLDGLVDDVRIYDRVLSGSEVSALYNAAAPTHGYFVLIGNQPTNDESNEFTGDLGGISGANSTCYTWLTTYDWLGKSDAQANGLLTEDNIKAWLCDDGGCQDMKPNSPYRFATTQDGMSGNGGAIFTTDASGFYPSSDTSTWDGTTHFNRYTFYWTGRDTTNVPDTDNCSNWTASGSQTGEQGVSNITTTSRWDSDAGRFCSTTDQFICFVNPSDCVNPTGNAGTIKFNAGAGPTDGLMASWDFDDGTGSTTAADGVGSLNGTLTNMDANTDWVAGKFGDALDFDGSNDWVSIPDDAIFDFSTQNGTYTWSAWVNLNDFSEWNAIWAQSPGVCNNDDMVVIYAHTSTDSFAGPVTAGVSALIAVDNIDYQVHSTDNVLTLNTWYHIAVTYDGGASPRFNIFVDGTNVTDTGDIYDENPTNPGTPTDMYIGAYPCAGERMNGRIDDVRYYTRVLSADEIATLAAGKMQYCNGSDWIKIGQ